MTGQQTKDKIGEELNDLFPFQLVDIRLYEITVSRGVEVASSDEETESSRLALSILLHSGDEPLDAEEFGLLVTLDLTVPSDGLGCRIFIALEGAFEAVVDVSTLEPEFIKRFKSSDALVLFWPYMRQTLHDITVRMRLSIPPLPVLDPRPLISELDESRETPE